jgi:hypothetical protein
VKEEKNSNINGEQEHNELCLTRRTTHCCWLGKASEGGMGMAWHVLPIKNSTFFELCGILVREVAKKEWLIF